MDQNRSPICHVGQALPARASTIELDGEACEVVGDETAIDALVGNLIDNACRYAPAGGTVHVHLSRQADRARLLIEDSGPGIPIHARERVFDRFHRELGTGVVGSGLGLSIVKQVLDQHAGSITLDTSETLGGLQVRVELPPAPAGAC